MGWVINDDRGEILLNIVFWEDTLYWLAISHPVINQVQPYSDATIADWQHEHWLRELRQLQAKTALSIEQYHRERYGSGKRLPRDRHHRWLILEQWLGRDPVAFLKYAQHWQTLQAMIALLELAATDGLTIHCYGD